jgi:hypothetical protein
LARTNNHARQNIAAEAESIARTTLWLFNWANDEARAASPPPTIAQVEASLSRGDQQPLYGAAEPERRAALSSEVFEAIVLLATPPLRTIPGLRQPLRPLSREWISALYAWADYLEEKPARGRHRRFQTNAVALEAGIRVIEKEILSLGVHVSRWPDRGSAWEEFPPRSSTSPGPANLERAEALKLAIVNRRTLLEAYTEVARFDGVGRPLSFRQLVRFRLWDRGWGDGLSPGDISCLESFWLLPISIDGLLACRVQVDDRSAYPARPQTVKAAAAHSEKARAAVLKVTESHQSGFHRKPDTAWARERQRQVADILAGTFRDPWPVHIGFRVMSSEGSGPAMPPRPCAAPDGEQRRRSGPADEVTCPRCLQTMAALGVSPLVRQPPIQR